MPARLVAQLVGVSKTYSNGPVLNDINLDLFEGQILGLTGANGSGKTTAMKILAGELRPDTGAVRIGGGAVQLASSADAIASGIRMLPQFLELYDSLSIVENIFIGQEITRRWQYPKIMAWGRMRIAAAMLLDKVQAMPLPPHSLAGGLSGGQKKAVALARLLVGPSKVLIFDEPMASLGVNQKSQLIRLFADEAARGCSVVFISHDVDDLLAVSDRIVVLRAGRVSRDLVRSELDARTILRAMGED